MIIFDFFAAFMQGSLMTVALALSSSIIGLVLGLFMALAKNSNSMALKCMGTVFSTVVRGIPEILWVLIIYYGGSLLFRELFSIDIHPFFAGVTALAICFAGYATETFRASLNAIPKGQTEAGLSLGLTYSDIMRHIIVPQMLKNALPALGNLFLILLKDTALVSVIGLQEIMRTGQLAVSVTKEPFYFYFFVAILYLFWTSIAMYGIGFLSANQNKKSYKVKYEY